MFAYDPFRTFVNQLKSMFPAPDFRPPGHSDGKPVRVLAKLRKMGVRTEKNRVVINDAAVLARYCEGDPRENDVAAR